MWRFTRLNKRLNTLRVGLFGAAALTILYARSDRTSPKNAVLSTEGIVVTEIQYPDSIKNPPVALPATRVSSDRQIGGSGASANVLGSASFASSSSASIPSYTVTAVSYAPDTAPTLAQASNCDDCPM